MIVPSAAGAPTLLTLKGPFWVEPTVKYTSVFEAARFSSRPDVKRALILSPARR